MTMPESPNETYVGGSTPSIKAATQNDLQTYLSRLYAILGFSVPTVGTVADQFAFVEEQLRKRFVIDHNGFPGGKARLTTTDWDFGWLTNVNAATSPDGRWVVTAAGGLRNFVVVSAPSSSAPYGGRLLSLGFGTGDATNLYAVAEAGQSVCADVSTVSWRAEFDVAMDAIGANNADHIVGLSAGQSPEGATEYIWFRKQSAQTNWFCEIKQGAGVALSNSSGVAPHIPSSGLQRLKIEVHGSATPYGVANGGHATVRFFIDDAPVQTYVDGTGGVVVPTTAMYRAMSGQCTNAAGPGATLTVGRLTLASNSMQ